VARDTEYASVIEFDGAARCAAVSASWSPWGRASGSVSGALDGSGGEGVEVVGQQPPPDPCSGAVVAAEPGAPESVVAFEVADAAFGADSVARQSLARPARGRLLATGDEDRRVGQRGVGLRGREAAVERGLARTEREPLKLGDGRGQQLGLVR
jgi:hypothetical protein